MNDQDLESLSNMDPNCLVDITGKEFMEQLKDSGRLGGNLQKQEMKNKIEKKRLGFIGIKNKIQNFYIYKLGLVKNQKLNSV